MTTFLFAVFPYIALVVFIVGMIWRYRYDKFGWTTRSSQLYESNMLRVGAPLFHYGILLAVLGHAMGLLIPKSWTNAIVSPEIYHMVAVVGGVLAGVMVTIGFLILVFRRRTVKTVFNATTVNDKIMYLVLGATIFFGMWNTISTALSHSYDYREGVSPWFRSIFSFQPQPELLAEAPIQFQGHAVTAFLLILILPFTRLVHMFSAPIGYLSRPYVVYRSRGDSGTRPNPSAHAPRGTWNSPTATKDKPGEKVS